MPIPPSGYGTDKCDSTAKYLWYLEAKETIREKKNIKKYTQTVYSLVIGQCTDAMIARFESHKHYSSVADERHGINLLRIIRSIYFDFQDQKYVAQSIHQEKQRFYAIKQGRH